MAHAKNHDYHILAPSTWPLIGAIAAKLVAATHYLWAGLAVGVLDPTVGQFMLMVVILTMFLPPALSAADRLLGRFFGEAGEWHPRTCRPRDRGSPHDYRRLRPDWASSG